jgi:hypothetical protein
MLLQSDTVPEVFDENSVFKVNNLHLPSNVAQDYSRLSVELQAYIKAFLFDDD